MSNIAFSKNHTEPNWSPSSKTENSISAVWFSEPTGNLGSFSRLCRNSSSNMNSQSIFLHGIFLRFCSESVLSSKQNRDKTVNSMALSTMLSAYTLNNTRCKKMNWKTEIAVNFVKPNPNQKLQLFCVAEPETKPKSFSANSTPWKLCERPARCCGCLSVDWGHSGCDISCV